MHRQLLVSILPVPIKRIISSKPTELVYRGYETLFLVCKPAQAIRSTVFNDKYADNSAAPFTKFGSKTAVG